MIPLDDAGLESFVVATAAAIDLPIAADERAAVVAAVRGVALQAAIVMAFRLPADAATTGYER